jgi:hypothetical protein
VPIANRARGNPKLMGSREASNFENWKLALPKHTFPLWANANILVYIFVRMRIKQKLKWYSISSGSFLLRILFLPANLFLAAATIYRLILLFTRVSATTANENELELFGMIPLLLHYSDYDKKLLLFVDGFNSVVLSIGYLIGFIGILCRRGILLKAQIIMMSLVTFIGVLYLSHQMFSLVTGGIPNLRTESDWIRTPDNIKLGIQQHLSCCGFNSSDTIIHPLEKRPGFCTFPSNSTLPRSSEWLPRGSCADRIRLYDEFPKDLITNRMFAVVVTGSTLYYVVLVVNSFLIWHFRTNPKIFRACCA